MGEHPNDTIRRWNTQGPYRDEWKNLLIRQELLGLAESSRERKAYLERRAKLRRADTRASIYALIYLALLGLAFANSQWGFFKGPSKQTIEMFKARAISSELSLTIDKEPTP